MARLSVAVALALVGLVSADVYMHNPRGSNDRNCERNANRNNGNRLFDSQNNAAGGYACPRAVGDDDTQAEDGSAGIAAVGGETPTKKIYYYEDSMLPIEWTNQHGCGNNSKANCEIVLQYMCEDTADPYIDDFWPYAPVKAESPGVQAFRSGDNIAAPRDGIPNSDDDAATDTIPDTEDAARPDSTGDRRYGMHESYDFYQLCQHTERNKGLYTADQRVRRNDQRGTRQNPNGNRRGLECPEERDYYPWWQPSPFIDIAILTNDASEIPCTDPDDCNTARCTYYLENSFNMNQKGFCDVDRTSDDVTTKFDMSLWNNRIWPNNEADCTANGLEWYTIALSDVLDVGYPECRKTGFSRVNQLGNAYDGYVSEDMADSGVPAGVNANRYMWTIPSIPTIVVSADDDAADDDDGSGVYFPGNTGAGLEDAYKSCILRMRYNLSTSDFPAWPAAAMEDSHPWKYSMVTAANNTLVENGQTDYSNTPLTQDPYIYIGAGDDTGDNEKFVSLAVNTNQYARTFQDRSYTFTIKPRSATAVATNDNTDSPAAPAMDGTETIFNVNVRGKRGNIVQTYPSVEYDFVPNSIVCNVDDLIHFQWTGSDYNPRRGCNDAEGGPPDPNNFVTSDANNARADRSNMIFMNSMAENVPLDYIGYTAYIEDEDDDNPSSLTLAEKLTSMETSLEGVTPCDVTDTDCFDTVMRLAFLNQQSDAGALLLRGQRDCLTQSELDDINNKQERENHPLNCAKMNAKPYPYFDAGIMKCTEPGKYSFFSSRNNNFSNRDQTGIICVPGTDDDGVTWTCDTDSTTGVLQDKNPALSTAGQRAITRQNEAESACTDEANTDDAANDQGASSCLTDSDDDNLDGESFTTEQAANDAMGDGDKRSCEEIVWFFKSGSTASYIVLAIILAFVGFGAAWMSVFCYNRIKRRRMETQSSQFSGKQSWKKDTQDPNMI